jgi:DNA-binding CsgD family transcriptional regulator
MSVFVAKRDSREFSARALRITPLERRALQLLATGHTTGDVATGLGISAVEMETLLADLFSAMGASTRVQAVAAAHRRGLLG